MKFTQSSIAYAALFLATATTSKAAGECSPYNFQGLSSEGVEYKCDNSDRYRLLKKSENALPAALKEPFPEVIIIPETQEQVVEIINRARDYNLHVCGRGGGHSYEGYAACDGGVLLDMRKFTLRNIPNKVTAPNIVEIGAGLILGEVYSFLYNNGLTLPAGTCPTVGVAGHALGGGYGMLARKYGFAGDRIVGATIVTSTGEVKTVSATENADLFWAIRGGGGGNFGIVTKFIFNAVALPQKVVNVYQNWNGRKYGKAVMKAFIETFKAHSRSDDWTVRIQLQGESISYHGIVVNTDVNVVRDELTKAFGNIDPNSRPNAYPMKDYGAAIIANQEKKGISLKDFKRETPSDTNFKRLTSAVFETFDDAAIDAMLNAWYFENSFPSWPSKIYRLFQFDPLGGAINNIGETDTAFPYRAKHKYMAQIFSIFDSVNDYHNENNFVNRIKQSVEPFSTGNYINYIDKYDEVSSYYGPNYDRLKAIKSKYEGSNVIFDFQQCIGSTVEPPSSNITDTCTEKNGNPYSSGFTQCCDGLEMEVKDWDNNNNYYYKCIPKAVNTGCTPLGKDPFAQGKGEVPCCKPYKKKVKNWLGGHNWFWKCVE